MHVEPSSLLVCCNRQKVHFQDWRSEARLAVVALRFVRMCFKSSAWPAANRVELNQSIVSVMNTFWPSQKSFHPRILRLTHTHTHMLNDDNRNRAHSLCPSISYIAYYDY